MSFKEDLNFGELGEQYVCDVLTNQGWHKLCGSHGKRYDGVYKSPSGLVVKIEVKNELRYKDSPNAFIETSCNGVPSGVSATQAHVMIHLFGDKIRVHHTEWLRWLLIDSKFRRVQCGDGYRVIGYLLPRDYDSPYLQECTEDELGSVIENICSTS